MQRGRRGGREREEEYYRGKLVVALVTENTHVHKHTHTLQCPCWVFFKQWCQVLPAPSPHPPKSAVSVHLFLSTVFKEKVKNVFTIVKTDKECRLWFEIFCWRFHIGNSMMLLLKHTHYINMTYNDIMTVHNIFITQSCHSWFCLPQTIHWKCTADGAIFQMKPTSADIADELSRC